ncbi:AAA ATPase midasin, partial [Entophlyctis luteolus]
MEAAAVDPSSEQAVDSDSDSDVGPMPMPAASDGLATAPPKKKPRGKSLWNQKTRILQHESLYLANLPACDMYEKSLMHRDVINFVLVTPQTDFLITTSVDGHVKFWKKTERGGIEFVKHYRAHLGPVVAISVSHDGALFASAGADRAIKVFDVVNFDMINILKLDFLPRSICWCSKKGDPRALLACSDLESPAIHVYDTSEAKEVINKVDVPLFSIPKLHSQSVHIMQYNAPARTVVSVDEGGMIEYWQLDIDAKAAVHPSASSGVEWTFKSDTDLYEFKKKFVTFGFDDRQVRVFVFRTGKMIRKYDESLSVVSEMQQAGTSVHRIDDMEFGRRLAMEKEIEKVKGGQSATANAIFDESGHFIIYASILGIKILNIETNRVVRLIGKMENQRFLNLSLYQGAPKKKGLITHAMAASENSTLRENDTLDPTLFCTAYKRNRFYMMTRREPDSDTSAATGNASGGVGRDIFNEKPSREEQTVAAGGANLKASLGSQAIIHTSYGDIHVRLFPEYAPKAVENFVGLAKKGYYDGVIFHRVIPSFMIQTGDPFGDGTGGESLWGKDFEDEFTKALKHDRPYTLSMANAGPNTNASQFFITTVPTPWLDNKHTIFGRATGGMDVVHRIEKTKTDKNEKPHEDIKILSIERSCAMGRDSRNGTHGGALGAGPGPGAGAGTGAATPPPPAVAAATTVAAPAPPPTFRAIVPLAAFQRLHAVAVDGLAHSLAWLRPHSALDVIACLREPLQFPLSPESALALLSRMLLVPSATASILRTQFVRALLVDLTLRWMDLSPAACESRIGKTHRDGSPVSTAAVSSLEHLDLWDGDMLSILLVRAFATLIPLAPQTLEIALECFARHIHTPPPTMIASLLSTAATSPVPSPYLEQTFVLAKSLFSLSRFDAAAFADLWDFSPLFAALQLHSETVLNAANVSESCKTTIPTMIACIVHTMANVLGMTDYERSAALQRFLGTHGVNDENVVLLRLIEEEDILAERAEMFRLQNENSQSDGDIVVTAPDLSSRTVDIAGILLPKPASPDASIDKSQKSLVWTSTTLKNLNQIAINVSIGAPVLVTGIHGSGKTCLVEEVARMVGQKDLLKIHLGDQTDSKILLGTYVCQSEPGSFKWQPGILTTAVMTGRWVLIEDLDLAPLEVISVLIPLLETGHLFIPARGEKVRAKQGFRLFATQTVAHEATAGKASAEMGSSLWNRVMVDSLPDNEMVEVIESKFPCLAAPLTSDADQEVKSLAHVVIKTFQNMAKAYHDASIGRRGGVSFRDVIKWCNRLQKLHSSVLISNPSTIQQTSVSHASNTDAKDGDWLVESVPLIARECLFREGLECFTVMIQEARSRDKVVAALGSSLSIPETRLEFFVEHFLPTVVMNHDERDDSKRTAKKRNTELSQSNVTVGRVKLTFSSTLGRKSFGTSNTFANTTTSVRLLEKLAVCVSMQEAVLLTGETGTGKTTVVQQLATMCMKNLTVINMSQQSDSTDLLGGFKPVEANMIAAPMLERFEALFRRTFSATSNAAYLESVRMAFIKKKWDVLKLGFGNAVKMADKVLGRRQSGDDQPQTKKSKKLLSDPSLIENWDEFSSMVKSFSAQLEHLKNSFLFSFVEGTLVKAITRGDWILLDEVNLATPETLESLSGILQSATGSLLLLERGDTEPIKRHPDFRLFACMNPANDAGKRDLPPSILSRFTEIWVDSPDTVRQDLALIIRKHLHNVLPPPTQGGNALVADIADFHTAAKAASEGGYLVDGSGHKVYFNLRTLARALGFASSCAPTFGIRRSVFEGCQMTYATILGKDSLSVITQLFEKHILNGVKNPGSFVKSVPKSINFEQQQQEEDDENGILPESLHVLFGAYWIKCGPLEANLADNYVLTPSVEANLHRVARAVMARKYPVLIQGPTSAGKTSMVEYLAMRTGHRFVRVNNHEHTDLQEYIGTYVSDSEGKLVFREVESGVLVEALRKGHWIVLDELNLAPSDVLESLNRLLDDNRELLIPETQEIVRPHPSFMLFATQNPPGLYGGRKQLSRAFRSRFIELHFDDIPEPELSTILERRCRLPPSFSAKIVASYKGLQNARQRSRIFEGKNAFATLRDLFRWGNRQADTAQQLAENGYMVIAEKSRHDDEKRTVQSVLEDTFRLKLDPESMYHREWSEFMKEVDSNDFLVKQTVWTNAMKRLFVLVLKCVSNKEPALLVGETGCGKTTVCQILTALSGINLQVVNAHAGSETSEFCGSMRPVR